MIEIYNANGLKHWDNYTIENEPISSLNLMERAATACCKKLLGKVYFDSVALVCGQGNNGGDGLAMARMLSLYGKKVHVYWCKLSQKGSPDFEANLNRLPSAVKVTVLTPETPLQLTDDIVIDCLFGSGLNRPIEGWLGKIVEEINLCQRTVLAIDVPSGLYVDDNQDNPLTHVVKANFTFTFQAPKMPFFFQQYSNYVGEWFVLDIGLHQDFKAKGLATYVDGSNIFIKKFNPFSYKGTKGYLTVIAGSEGMTGAPLLTGKAAFKTGCGYVGMICPDACQVPLNIVLPEVITHGENPDNLPHKTAAIAIGPGLGKSERALKLLKLTLKSKLPMVIDADALNLLAEHTNLLKTLPKGAILTPHLGELKRLIGDTQSPEERLEKQVNFSKKYQVFIIQKGAYSKLTTPDGAIIINSTGNSSMASAGMGDALTGIIGSFLAQGYTAVNAAINGMYFHGKAGDIVRKKIGANGVVTSDLISAIPEAVNGI